MAFVSLNGATYGNGSEDLLGTDGGDDVKVTITGNAGPLTGPTQTVLAVGLGEAGSEAEDDPIAVFGRPVAAVEMTIGGTHGFAGASDYLLDANRDIPGEEYAIYINGVKLTAAQLQDAVDAGTAGLAGYEVNPEGNLIKPDSDPTAEGTLVFDAGPQGINSFQIDTVPEINNPGVNLIPISEVTLAVDTSAFVALFPDNPDAIIGTEGDDVLEGTPEADEIAALGGNDRVAAGGDDDLVLGGEGEDSLYGNGGDDTLLGEEGNDRLFGRTGDDLILGGTENDRLKGQDGEDTLLGEADDDRLEGGRDDDIVSGGGGDDLIRGNLGNDIYIGGDGSDFMIGEKGAEHFLFSQTEDDTEEFDTINAFDVTEDKLVIAGFNIGDEEGQITAAEFLEANGSIKGKNLLIELGDNHVLKLKNVVDGDFAGAEPKDFAALVLGETGTPEDITTEEPLPGDDVEYLDLGDGFYLPLIPIEETDVITEDVDDADVVDLLPGF